MRTRSPLALAALLAAAGCGSDDPASTAQDVTIDSFNVGLAGAFIPYEPLRRQAVGQAVAGLPSDVVCLQEVWRQEDKDAIIAAARARFPHAYSLRHDFDTPTETPPAPAGCTVAPPSTQPPCASAPIQTSLDNILQCLAQNCSTMPGSMMGQTTSTACARERCIAAATALLTAGDEGSRCYGCVAPNLPTESFASIRQQCTSNPRAGLAFGGQSGVMILSRYPLTETEAVVLPGTWNQRPILHARVTLPNGAALRVFCNHLTPVFEDIAFPYTGRYGCGDTDRTAWAREQGVQIQRLASYVTERAGAGRAVILGDFNTGPRVGSTVVPEAEDNYMRLAAAFTNAAPSSFASCTFCPDNALNGMRTNPVWIDHIFLRNVPASAVRSFQRTLDQPTVATMAAMGPAMVPLSDHYGVRAVLSLSP